MTRLGRYKLGQVLGTGGAGRVYAATLEGPGSLRKAVAVKLLHDGAASLHREARIGGLLRHRHIVDVYEVGEAEGQAFCAMELCAGGALSHRPPLPPRAVVEVGLQVCAALRYAHEELGLVHSDIKPDNLLLSASGEVKVADMGIARADGFGADRSVSGTSAYMAPEQVRGEPIDARADVYAVGVTLAQLATGQRPGAAETMDGFALDDEPATAPLEWVDWLQPVLDRCLAPEREDRFANMNRLADALRALSVDGPGLAEFLGLESERPSRSSVHDLPQPMDSFEGRTSELERLATALSQPGLVTIKGAPGLGKSRLAVAGAAQWQATHAGTIWYLDLGDASTAAGLHGRLATALDVHLRDEDPATFLGAVLAGRGPAVLLLDNVDHVRATAPSLEQWTRDASELRVLVTSRTALGVPHERIQSIASLDEQASLALLTARAEQRGVVVRQDDALIALAKHLDGVPLAIELAAGRLGVLGPQDILDRLGKGVLRSVADGRHGTLQAALEWSWDLLSERERSALGQLSVFRGGQTLEAVQAVLDLRGDGSTLRTVEALVEHSLVRVWADGRLDLLSTIRTFAAQLVDTRDAETRHGEYYARFGSPEGVEALDGPGGQAAFGRMRRELANLVVACTRAVARRDGDAAVATLHAAVAVLRATGPFDLSIELADAVHGMPGLSAPQQALAGCLTCACYKIAGHLDEARVLGEASLALYRELGDRPGEVGMIAAIATLDLDAGKLQEAAAGFSEALQHSRALGLRGIEARTLGNQGIVAAYLGRRDEERRCYESAIELYRSLGDKPGEAHFLGSLGTFWDVQGNFEAARANYRAAVSIHQETGDRRIEGVVLGNLGVLHARNGMLERARVLLTDALARHREVGNRSSEGVVLGNLGQLNEELEDIPAARACLQAAAELAKATGHTQAEGLWLSELARVVGGPEAPSWLRSAEAILREAGNPALLAVALATKAEMLSRRGAGEEAVAALDEAAALAPEDDEDVARSIARARATLAESR